MKSIDYTTWLKEKQNAKVIYDQTEWQMFHHTHSPKVWPKFYPCYVKKILEKGEDEFGLDRYSYHVCYIPFPTNIHDAILAGLNAEWTHLQ